MKLLFCQNMCIGSYEGYDLYTNKWLKGCGSILGAVYICSMVIHPLYIGGFNTLMETWSEWQTFNAGMIAILAAVISGYIALKLDKSARQREAVNINASRQNEKRKLRAEKKAIDEQRHRELIAASAFLPASLILINDYVDDVSKKLLRSYAANKTNNDMDLRRYIDEVKGLSVPDGYQGVFKECITLATPDVSEHLVYILVHLQVFSSRIESLNPNHLGYSYLEEMLVDSIRFQLKIDSLFDFARKGLAVKELHRDVESYYSRISRSLNYHVEINRGDSELIDKFVDSAARRD